MVRRRSETAGTGKCPKQNQHSDGVPAPNPKVRFSSRTAASACAFGSLAQVTSLQHIAQQMTGFPKPYLAPKSMILLQPGEPRAWELASETSIVTCDRPGRIFVNADAL